MGVIVVHTPPGICCVHVHTPTSPSMHVEEKREEEGGGGQRGEGKRGAARNPGSLGIISGHAHISTYRAVLSWTAAAEWRAQSSLGWKSNP